MVPLGTRLQRSRGFPWKSWITSWLPWLARYDGNPEVAFIDVGSSVWGEGHTYSSSDKRNGRDGHPAYRPLSEAFQETLLAANDDYDDRRR